MHLTEVWFTKRGKKMGRNIICVDIGGTFTDVIALDVETGEVVREKVLSTPREPEIAMLGAISDVLKRIKGKEVEFIVHASTIATNAILGQVGLELPKCAMLTTKGFRDIIVIGRQQRPELYNIFFQKPRELIQRKYRFEIEERTGPDGSEITPLNQEDVKRAISKIKEGGIKAVAICFLNSYANPTHEIRTKNLVEKECKVFTVASSEICPEYREYERFSTAVVNAVLMPIVSSYLERLRQGLEELGLKCPLLMMKSSGGLISSQKTVRMPAAIIESGPAAGVIAATFYAELIDLENILSFDMGGTTAKAGTIVNRTPEVTREYEVGGRTHKGRLVKGSGYPVRFPFIDLAECSAGGGTIAWVDEGGFLRVGPISAGSDPGPACYGKGGINPTVTDANVVLGRLNPRYLLGGALKIHKELAEKAIKEKICDCLGLDLVEAASGVIEIVNSEMSRILRIMSVERGLDPREFALMAFGGAGPMHACWLAEELSINLIIIPPDPGLFSAWGLMSADVTHEVSKPLMTTSIDHERLEDLFESLEKEAREVLLEQGIKEGKIFLSRELDVRYLGQSYELQVSVPPELNKNSLNKVIEAFHEKHRRTYGYYMHDEEVEFVNARVKAIGRIIRPNIPKQPLQCAVPDENSILGHRYVHFREEGFHKTPIYIRERLKPGNVIEGPAIIEQYDTTTVIPPEWSAKVDEFGSLKVMR